MCIVFYKKIGPHTAFHQHRKSIKQEMSEEQNANECLIIHEQALHREMIAPTKALVITYIVSHFKTLHT